MYYSPYKIDYTLDIKHYVCPITFIKAKMLMESMHAGEVAQIILSSGEPLEQLPKRLIEQGNTIIGLFHNSGGDGRKKENYILIFRKEEHAVSSKMSEGNK